MMEAKTLKNGMRVHLVPFEGTEATTVLILTKVGSRYEYKEINGAAHFIEHLMFKGTEKRPSTLDISRELDAVGAEFNAYTGKDLTGYYIKIDGKHEKLAIDLLHDMLFHSVYDSEEMDRERKVIKEEINMYTDNPIMHVEELLEEQMFEGNTLSWNIAGTHQTMDEMTRENVIAFRDAHYIPERMVIAVAGKVDEQTMNWLEETFGSVATKGNEPEGFEAFSHPEARERSANIQFKDTQQIQVMLGFPAYKMDDEKYPAAKLLAIILGGTMSSRLFVQVRERKGLAYMVRASLSPYEDSGLLTIQSGLDQSRLPLAMETILGELEKMKTEGVTADELREAKDHLYGKSMLKLEDSSDRAEWFARQELFLNEAKTPEEWIAKYADVTQADVKDVAEEIFDEARMGIAAIGPYKSGEEFLAVSGLKK